MSTARSQFPAIRTCFTAGWPFFLLVCNYENNTHSRLKRGACFRFLALLVVSIITNVGTTLVAAETPRPNIVVLVSDDQRPDTIHALGNELIKTPHLDRLVSKGTAFLRATCANPICTPSRAEILTGCTSFRNGVLDFGKKIADDVALWPRTMSDAGYTTWYVGKWHNDGLPTERGYAETNGLYRGGGGRWAVPMFDWNGRPVTGYRGWLFQNDKGQTFPQRGIGLTGNISADFANAAIELIKRNPSNPYFLHVNFTAPHDPLMMPHGYESMYDPTKIPAPSNFLPEHPFDHGNFDGRDEKLFRWPRTKEEVQRELAAYYAVISHMDAQIGRILEAVEQTGEADNTIVVFTSDHGLGLGSHGLRGKQSMYEHTIGVPLVLRGPGVPKGKQSNAQCYLRDLFPTTCELADVKIPASVQGRSLKPVLDGKKNEVYPFVVGYFRNFQRTIRTDQWKLISYPHLKRSQLFNLQNDPLEKHDLSQNAEHQETMATLRQQLMAWLAENGDPLLRD